MPDTLQPTTSTTVTHGEPGDHFEKLILANHILHYHNVVDAYGHVSVRNPHDHETFFMSRESPPALVSRRDDIEEYYVSDASPVNKNAAKGYSERFIHSEIYKRYHGVHAVVHAHSPAILPFTITNIPLRPVMHVSASMGPRAPVYDIADYYNETDKVHTLLVDKQHLGAGLAGVFNPVSKESDVPEYQTVLMRGHGFSCVADTIEMVVYRAIYTVSNASIQAAALQMQSSHNLSHPDERGHQSLHYLSDREVEDTRAMHAGSRGRPWKLWCAEVTNSSLYKNQYLESK